MLHFEPHAKETKTLDKCIQIQNEIPSDIKSSNAKSKKDKELLTEKHESKVDLSTLLHVLQGSIFKDSKQKEGEKEQRQRIYNAYHVNYFATTGERLNKNQEILKEVDN